MSNRSIWRIDRTLSGTTSPCQSGAGSDVSEGVLCIAKSFSITEASLSDCLVSYPEHSVVKSYPSTEMQLAYSAAPADWAISNF